MRLHHDERGQTILLVALSLPLLLGFVGIATDVGALFKDKRTAQTAADAAAIAGALNYNFGTSAWQAAAKAAAASNGFADGSNGVTVTVPAQPSWPASNYYHQPGYIEATVTRIEPTIFLALFGHPSVTVLARAVATLGPSNVCVDTLGTSGDNINVNNGASLDFSGCGILDDSTSPNALTVTQGAHLTASTIGIVSTTWSSSQVNNGGSLTPSSPSIGIVPVSDPLSYLTAPSYTPSGCLAALNINTSETFTPVSSGGGLPCYNGISFGGGATVTVNNPGVLIINGDFNIANGAQVTLGPGLYYITGALLGQGGSAINGTGVTFYMTGTNLSGGAGDPPEINLANGVNLNLAAPNSAGSTYNGMLFWQASTDVQPIIIAGGANATLKGAIYAPDASLSVSNGSSTNIYVDLIVNSLTTVGGSTVHSYESLSGVAPVLTAAVLVE